MRTFTSRWLWMGLFLVAGLLHGLPGAAFADETANEDAAIELVHPGTLTVCTHMPYKPFEFVGDDRELVGFDVDLARMLADRLGVDMQIIDIGWNQITSGLVFAAGKCDVAMGGATITPKRAEAVLFSDPYFSATQALLTKKGAGIHSLADLEGKQLGAETATTGLIYARKHADEYGYEVVIYADTALQTNSVSAGNVPAVIQDNTVVAAYAQTHPETVVAAELDTGERYGFMAKRDDANAARLIDLFNTALAEAQADSRYEHMLGKWFPGLGDSAK